MSRTPPPPVTPSAEVTLDLAHALRTPLTSLSLGLGLLDDGALGPLTAAQRDVVRTLVTDAARLARLVDSALRTERLGIYTGPIEPDLFPTREIVEAPGGSVAAQSTEEPGSSLEIMRTTAGRGARDEQEG